MINTLLVVIFGEDAHRFNKTDTVKRVIFTFNEGTTVNSYTSSSSGSFISFKKKYHKNSSIHGNVSYRDFLSKHKMSVTSNLFKTIKTPGSCQSCLPNHDVHMILHILQVSEKDNSE